MSEWDDVANVKSGLLAAVDGLTGGGAFSRDEELLGLATKYTSSTTVGKEAIPAYRNL